MIAVLIRFFLPILIFTVLPYILVMLFKKNMARTYSHTGNREGNAASSKRKDSFEMVKDQVCGKYIVVENSIKLVEKGIEQYFCSELCKQKYVSIHHAK